ncbi:MAG: MaoC family dehydratase [Candidatus Rokubacteria bacterium]|nr:MaoC family dehydratase [Candidatus Rokubacteria bacterium]
MLERLIDRHLKARNTWERGGENVIHDDATARAYGFRGGLVPGITVYAYLTRPLVDAFGAAWLARGTASVRFLKPVIEDDEVTLAGAVTAREPTGVTATVTATTPLGDECATLTATVPAGSPTPVNPALYRAARLPAERPVATRAVFEGLDVLGTSENLYDEARAVEYTARVSDDHALYRGPAAWAHPGFLLEQCNRALSRNVQVAPWIHVGSVVRHLGGARVGDTLATRGRVRSLFEKKGRNFVELDLLIVAGRRPVAHVLHTAIYRLPPPDPAPR